MCLPSRLESVRFASLLSYVPEYRWRHVGSVDERLDELRAGREYMISLKRGHTQPGGLLPIYDSIAKWCADLGLFPDFFSKGTTVVPVPSSLLTRPGTLWVPMLLAEALVGQGLGASVAACLHRTAPVPKSTHSRPKDRATPAQHYKSMRVRQMITEPESILLVDDLVTRGSTFLGAACRMAESYPNARIKAFAAMRTVSNLDEFVGVGDWREGTITPTGNGSRRQP